MQKVQIASTFGQYHRAQKKKQIYMMQKVHIASTFGQYHRAQKKISVLQVVQTPSYTGASFSTRDFGEAQRVIGKPKNASSLLVPCNLCEAFP